MPHDHEGQRVSRRTLIRGITSLSFGGVLAACGTGDATTASSAPAGSLPAGSTPAASTTDDLTSLFAGVNTCRLTATTTQGPYYFDADKIRSDVREDRPGARLRLVMKVQDSEACGPMPGAIVEIWHCDASGVYSGAEAQSTGSGGGGGPGGGPPPGGGQGNDQSSLDLVPTDDDRFLRGAQVSNAAGIVEFTTIWPGWYRGRTVHVHVMVHVSNKRVLTTQLMFDEKLNSTVFAAAPYAGRTGRDTFNDGDSIYRDSMLLKVTRDGDGWLGAIALGVDSDSDGV
jgi:protocatechuate 3,4-dioxygenase beta subunit